MITDITDEEKELINYIRNNYMQKYSLYIITKIIELVRHSPNNKDVWISAILAIKDRLWIESANDAQSAQNDHFGMMPITVSLDEMFSDSTSISSPEERDLE